jgi:hypothetical protein
MAFLTGNDLRNKILKYWHDVTGHYIALIEFGKVKVKLSRYGPLRRLGGEEV